MEAGRVATVNNPARPPGITAVSLSARVEAVEHVQADFY